MPENLTAPIGLRANGAFTIKGLKVHEGYKEIQHYDDIEKCVEELLRTCNTEIEILINKFGNDFRKFINYSKGVKTPGLYEPVLVEMLLDIKEGKYHAAERLAISEMDSCRYGNLENQGKDIYEHVVEFCRNKYREV